MPLRLRPARLGLALLATFAALTAAEARPKNVVLLLADDLSPHLSILGTPGIATPHLDALARSGSLHTRAYAVAASCSPSRSSILTGMYPHSNGHWRNTATPHLRDPDSDFTRAGRTVDRVGVHEDIPTLPELLGAAGYHTAIFDKFHLSPPWKFPFAQRRALRSTAADYTAATRELLRAAGDKPFFVQANISPPHLPFRAHLGVNPDHPLPDANLIAVPPFLADTPRMRRDLQKYYASVEIADQCVGAVLAALREAGQLENTLVIFTGDQGMPYHRSKASAYPSGFHVPLIFSGPGVQARLVSPGLASLIDLAPTVLEFLGLPTPANVQGCSLWPVLRGEVERLPGRDFVVGEHHSHGPSELEWYPQRALTDGRYYYMLNLMPEKPQTLPDDLCQKEAWGNDSYDATLEAATDFPVQHRLLTEITGGGRPAEELYDLHTDPGAVHNLAADPAFLAVRRRMAAQLVAWRAEYRDIKRSPSEISRRTR